MSENKNDTNFLRAIGILLVINSHMDFFYANSVFATGGMLGNSLFFMLSSYGLFVSWAGKHANPSFGEWYGRRIARIYPSVWVISLLLFIPYSLYQGVFTASQFLEKMEVFFYPPFWFLKALLLYYIFMYFILRYYTTSLLFAMGAGVAVFYALYYAFILDVTGFSIESIPFKLIFYFLVVLWGFYLASIREKIHFHGTSDMVLLVLSVGIIYIHKFMMYKGYGSSLQFIQHAAVFPILYYSLKIAKARMITNNIMSSRIAGRTVQYISTITLELFMVNNILAPIIGGSHIPFPLNGILFLALTAGFAVLIYYGSKYLRQRLFVKTVPA